MSQFKIQIVTSFYTFFAQVSQYFSISIAPSTLNNASWVAILPQLMQNFDFLPLSTNVLIDEKVFSILSSCLLNCYSSGWSNYEFYILIHDSVMDNEYKNIYRNDLLKFHALSSIILWTVPPGNSWQNWANLYSYNVQ